VKADVLDLRSEAAFNLFHVGGARLVDPAALSRREELRSLQDAGATTVTFLVGESEEQALAAWRRLRVEGVTNLYVVEGGMDRWLDLYPAPACVATRAAGPAGPGGSAWRFSYATGSSLPSAWPEVASSHQFRFPCQDPAEASGAHRGGHGHTWPDHPFTKRVELRAKSVVKGGCG
jgi:rhodanese-related sulfurtransferase